MKIFSFRGDGWWPKLSADGQYIAFGGGGIPSEDVPPMVSVFHIQTGRRVLHQAGRAIHWMGPLEVCWLVNDGPMRDVMWGAQIVSPDMAVVVRTPYDPLLVAANDFSASDAHWASWLAEGQRLVVDGVIVPGRYRGVDMSGRYLLTVHVDRNRFSVFRDVYRDGAEWRSYPLPERANSWTVSREGYIGYGYYWPSHVITPNGRDINITAAEWGQESVPLIVHVDSAAWAWTHTVRPSDSVSIMCGRPLPDRDVAPGESPCIQIDDFPADSFDAVCVDERWIVAGFSGTGALAVHVVSLNQPRQVVRDGSSPPPTPDPDPPVDEEDPVQLEPKHSALITAFADRFPPPGDNEDELRDNWTPRLVAQFVYDFPGEGWGWKSTSQGSRPSSDVIARRTGGKTWGYDVIIGAGTDGWMLVTNAGPMDLSSQAFIAVDPKNWLGETAPPVDPPVDPPTTPPVTPPPISVGPIVTELNESQQIQLQTIAAIAGVADALDGLRDILEHMRAHDLVIADEIRKNAAVTLDGLEKVRATIAGGVRIKF